MASMLLRIVVPNQAVKEITLTQMTVVLAQPGAIYSVIDVATKKPASGIVLKKQGDTLVIEIDKAPVAQIERFYSDDGVLASNQVAAAFDVAPIGGEAHLITRAEPADQSSQIVWPHDSRPIAFDTSTGALLGLGLLALAGGGGGASAPVNGFANAVQVTVVGGPVLPTNGLKVDIFKANGEFLTQATLDAKGQVTMQVGEYRGVIIAKVAQDADATPDYLDEATGAGKDLNVDLFGTGVIAGSNETLTLNLNLLSTLAYKKAIATAGVDPLAGQGSLDAITVTNTNAAVAKVFGLADLHSTTVITTNGTTTYNPADGLSAGETYGNILAALSGADKNNGGNTQITLDALVTGTTITGTTATLSESAQAEIIKGGQTAAATTGGGTPAIVDTVVDTIAPAITSRGTATAIDENSGAGQPIYIATATDVSNSVIYSLKADVGDSTAFSINPSTGAVKLSANPDFEIKPSYSFTVVATDAAGNATERAVSLAINNLDDTAPVITSGTAATAISENSGASQVVYTAAATDASALTYSLKAATGDVSAFSINPSTGAVTLSANPDFETKPSYNFTVVATDAAGNRSEQAVTLAINDVFEAPPDSTAPTVSSVAITSATGAVNSTLNAGDIVSITVTMSEATIVSTSGGTPRIMLYIDDSPVYASYASGSGTTALIFTYIILQSAPLDGDGISIPANSLSANGGALADAAANSAILTHSGVADNGSYLVDTTVPTTTISAIHISADTAGTSTSDFITSTASQTITGTLSTGLVAGEILYGSVDGGTTWVDITNMVSTTSISWTGATLSGTSSIKFKVADAAGNDGTPATQAYTLDTTLPAQTVSAVHISTDNGPSTTDFTTSIAAQTITGTLSAGLATGEILYGSIDGGGSWTDITNMVSSGTAISWTGATLAGSSSIVFYVKDAAGNSGSNTGSTAYVLHTPPKQTVSAVDILTDSGSSASDFITNTAGQTITGTLSGTLGDGDILYGSIDGGTNWIDITNMVSSGTAISWTGATLTGTSSIVFKVTDSLGYDSPNTGSTAYTLDTAAPTATTSSTSISTNANANAVVQSTEAGTAYLVSDSITVTSLADITGAVGTAWNSVAVSTANVDTNLAATGLAAGGYHVYTVDAAGNLSAQSGSGITVASAPSYTSVIVYESNPAATQPTGSTGHPYIDVDNDGLLTVADQVGGSYITANFGSGGNADLTGSSPVTITYFTSPTTLSELNLTGFGSDDKIRIDLSEFKSFAPGRVGTLGSYPGINNSTTVVFAAAGATANGVITNAGALSGFLHKYLVHTADLIKLSAIPGSSTTFGSYPQTPYVFKVYLAGTKLKASVPFYSNSWTLASHVGGLNLSTTHVDLVH